MNTPIGREGKQAKPRQLHNTQWGMVCPCEVPEGQAVGLVKNLSLMAYVSVGQDSAPVVEVRRLPLHGLVPCGSHVLVAAPPQLLDEWGLYHLEDVEPAKVSVSTKVFVNGNWIGVVPNPEEIVRTLREHRRNGTVHWEVSVVRDVFSRVRCGDDVWLVGHVRPCVQEIQVFSDAGRICRPLFVVGEDQKLVIKVPHVPRSVYSVANRRVCVAVAH